MDNIKIQDDFKKLEQDLLSKWEEVIKSEEKCENLDKSLTDATSRINLYEKISKRRTMRRDILTKCAIAASILLIASALLKYSLHINSYNDAVKTILSSNKTLSLYAPTGETATITLSDSTTVILNSGSQLIYPEVFDSSSRELHLMGEAYFSVAKDKSRPFIVCTPYMKVKALGTSFTVKAYQKDETESATLLSGSIEVTPNNSSIESKTLVPDEQLVLSHDGKYYAVFNVNSKHDASWIEGKMIFENVTFEDVINRLECQFGVVIYYNKSLYSTQRVVAKFIHDESLTDILNTLKDVFDFEYSFNENRYMLYKPQNK